MLVNLSQIRIISSFIISLTCSISIISSVDAKTNRPAIKQEPLQLIVLLDKIGNTDKLVFDSQTLSEDIKSQDPILRNTKEVEYLIKSRRKIGIQKNLRGLTPEELEKLQPSRLDMSLVHPKSTQGILQRFVVITYPDKQTFLEAKKSLLETKKVKSVTENPRSEFLSVPNDTFYSSGDQWGIDALNLPDAWSRLGGHAYIGLPDSGLAHSQNDTDNFRAHFSWDFADGDNDVEEPGNPGFPFPSWFSWSAHGTHVFGIIVATTDNLQGVAGTCRDCSVAFTRMKFDSQVIQGYHHLHDLGVQAVNTSLGTADSTQQNKDCSDLSATDPFCAAITALTERDIIISTAAGNGNDVDGSRDSATGRNDFIQFPASDHRTIAVGAIKPDLSRAEFSDYGSQLDLVAPGFDIQSTMHTGFDWNQNWFCGDQYGSGSNSDGYGHCSGTSMSAPFITGILGLMRSADPLLPSADHANTGIKNIRDYLFEASSHYNVFPPNPELANGLPDAAMAVDKVLGQVNSSVLENRLTPLFSFLSDYQYLEISDDSFYTTVPQMGYPAINGTILPQDPYSWLRTYYTPHYGSPITKYPEFPHGPFTSNVTPVAESYIFTTENNPLNAAQSLVPLYRLSYQGTNPVNGNITNLDHVYTTNKTGSDGVDAYKAVGYKFDGIEGYIYSKLYSQPAGTENLYRMYNPSIDDHALFPESKYHHMISQGYTDISGNNAIIGYVYTNTDTDNDGLIDGFERVADTCINDADSDKDGVSDGDELLINRTDPLSSTKSCSNNVVTELPWQTNATGYLTTDIPWNYAMGYHFTPLVNGQVTKLGGFFNGFKQVKLFNKTTGQLLAHTSISASNNWGYSDITPVSVQAGTSYTVAAYLAGSGASYRQSPSPNYPINTGGIRIDDSTFVSTSSNPNARPTNNASTIFMYGQADIGFVADSV